MSLPGIAIRRPVFAWMLMCAVILFGMISFSRLGISQLPDVDFPVVSVSLTLNGAAPEVVESQVLDPLEDAIMEIDGIRSVTSSAQQSSGSIAVEFELNRDIDESMQEIQNKINQVKNVLPVNLFPPTLRKSNPEDSPIIWLALTSDDPKERPIDLMIYARNVLFDQFATLPGVGNIALGGYVDPALRVWVDLKKLDYYNLTSDDLLNAINQENLELPAGMLEAGATEYNLRTIGQTRNPEEFGQIRINNRTMQGPNYNPTKMSQVALIEEGTVDVRKMARFNGKPAVGLGILKQHGSNAVEVASQVREKLKKVQLTLPARYHLSPRNDSTRFIKQSVDELLFILCLSALLTSLVCYLFLGSLTSTINVLMSIPTSIVGTFTAFYFFHFTLNTFTLLGLSLAIGIVVDDAIMMLENIVRHMELGTPRREAALRGSDEISFAAMAATIAVVAIFMPVVFMKGVIGRYFLQYGVTVTAAVLLSLLEALTLTPMRCSRYLTVDAQPRGLAGLVERIFHVASGGYRRILERLLNHRLKTIVVTLVIFVGSLGLAKLVPSEMMPAQDQSQLLMRFKMPVGTSLPATDQKIKQVEDYLLKQPEVEGVFSAVGGFGGDAVNQGMAFVTLVDRDKRKKSQAELIQKFRTELKERINAGQDWTKVGAAAVGLKANSKLPKGDKPKPKGMEIVIQDLSLRGFASSRGFPVEVIVQGPDWDKLTEVTSQLMSEMKKSGFVTDVNTDIQPGMPEVQIHPDRAKLAQHAVGLNTVTSVVNALVGGAVLNKESSYTKDGHRYEIELRLQADQRDKPMDLSRIKIRNNRGEVVPVSELVSQDIQPSLMLISRLNRARAITVYANPANGHSQQEALKSTEQLARKLLPPGYTLKMTGTSQSFQESFQSLIFAMILGILVSYMVLASQFNSFIHPVTVLMALPFSISGAFLGLLAFHQTINIYSLIGFILLMGIVKKNSILLVDFTNQMRAEGHDVRTALLKACPVRLRPIVMTSVATIAGALPEALSIGPGAEATIPMAVAIIGGVAVSTFLTLFVVPCVYSLLTRLESRDPLELAAREIENKAARERAAAGHQLA
jgi:HAE1 family hydrophobic/amphiphilic exporter-1